jgi:hypothetical protein
MVYELNTDSTALSIRDCYITQSDATESLNSTLTWVFQVSAHQGRCHAIVSLMETRFTIDDNVLALQKLRTQLHIPLIKQF